MGAARVHQPGDTLTNFVAIEKQRPMDLRGSELADVSESEMDLFLTTRRLMEEETELFTPVTVGTALS
ncbi:hypothetical protein Slin15195_G122100 [Septoria linicola]|uniref:Uncharacterized protein n=1 Tax=Septoria linicola TaxID=215465 RepID=A0A9Q9EPL5_9PEZI|nr:hypothetical protein Slin14017_G078310 [Septoria linicola]USW58891.1 hypothetical protein Slin15195_G122100 [Septoria linicola]